MLIPVNALWALPTVGWLLLCSSFVRSKPFLWAVVLPLLVGFVVAWINLIAAVRPAERLVLEKYLRPYRARRRACGLISTGLARVSNEGGDINVGLGKLDFVHGILSFDGLLGVLWTPELWIGVLAGAAMIAAAVHFRQSRTEAYA